MSTALQDIEPKGIWRTPLSKAQVEAAVAFGIDAAKDTGAEFPIDDAFRVPTDELPNTILTVSTAFERIAKYALAETQAGRSIDDSVVQSVANEPLFMTHYTLDFVSGFKAISILRFMPIVNPRGQQVRDGYENMTTLYHTQIEKGTYRQVVAFPFAHASPYDFKDFDDGVHTDHYEVVVPAWLPFLVKMSATLQVDLHLYH